MNLIKSDKSGRHIHSPFVYRLVANVIFAPYPFYSFTEIDKMAVNSSYAEELKIIFRLVNFFRFEEVHIIGTQDDFLEKTCKMAKQDLFFFLQEEIPKQTPPIDKLSYARLLIWDSYNKENLPGWVPKSPEVWILRDLKNSKQVDFFSKLKTHDKVKISLELNNLGIIIFNEIFEKENYVIKY